MKILFVSHTANIGCGAENCLVNLLSGISDESIDSVVVVPEEGGPMEKELELLGITCIRTPIRWWIGSEDQLYCFPQDFGKRVEAMGQLIELHNIDVVVTNTSVIMEGAVSAAKRRLPHIWYIHEMLAADPYLRTPAGAKAAYSFMDAFSSSLIVVSNAVREEILNLCPDATVQVVHTGMDIQCKYSKAHCRATLLKRTGFESETVIAGFIGVLSERKGVMILADVAHRLRKEIPELRFVVIGPDGGKEEELKAAIGQHGFGDIFYLAGSMDNVLPWMNGLDVLLLPSLADPFPLVLHEAMHLHLPIVATHSGGASEIVINGETGFLTEPGDADSFSAALLKLVGNASLRRCFGDNGTTRAKTHFSRNVYAKKFCSLLKKIAGSTPNPNNRIIQSYLDQLFYTEGRTS